MKSAGANSSGESGKQEEGVSAQGQGAQAEPPHPVPGAQKAPDGEYYLTDPTRRGRFLRIAPLAQEHARPGIMEGV